MHSSEELDASLALKAIARNTSLKTALLQMPAVYSALWSAARRFVTGEIRTVGVEMAKSWRAWAMAYPDPIIDFFLP